MLWDVDRLVELYSIEETVLNIFMADEENFITIVRDTVIDDSICNRAF